MAQALPIARLIAVAVNLSITAAQAQNTSTLLVLGTSTVINTVERQRSYTSIDQVAADFGTSGEEYLSALLWFEQAPQPTSIIIGRWAKTATAGQLICATGAQSLATWTAITTGSFAYAKDGGAPTNVTALNFSAATTLSGVAAIIQTALVGVTCIWNSAYNRFEFTSATTGAASAVSFLTAAGSGSDISALLAGRSTSSGAYTVQGVVAESAVAATTYFDSNFGQQWYALTIPSAGNADHLAVAAYIEAGTNKHLYGVTTTEAGVLSAVTTTDIAYQLSQLAYKHTTVQWSSTNPCAVCSLLGRILTTNYNGNNTVITLMYKQEPGIVPETLNQTQITALEGKKCNVFVAYNNNTAIIEQGVVCSGDFVDIITGTDWLALTIQTALYNLLYTSTTKIPQTDAGNQVLVTGMTQVLQQAVRNGLLAPGVWSMGGFGTLNQNDYLQDGFYVYAPPVAQQNVSDRGARKSVAFQIAAKLAGAIHTVNVQINVNR